MNDEVAIKVSKVSKQFILPHERTSSVKGAFLSILNPKKKTYETQRALQGISFEVKKGEFFGIVGRNGSGKSTILKILAGIYQPTQGTVFVRGKIVPFIELGVGFNGELTGRENVYLNGALLGFSDKQVKAKYQAIVEFAELERFMDQKLKNYSSGMQVRLAFSVATRLAESDILLIDEVLAVGDADFQRKCFNYFQDLKRQQKTVIFVSHDMNAIREYCGRAILISESELILEGSANEVGTAYTRMFMDNEGEQVTTRSKRWGDGAVKYDSVHLTPSRPTDRDNEILLTLIATAKEDCENLNFGFSIKDASGVILLGTNTKIKKIKIDLLKKNQTITLKWRMPNIFGDGQYFVDPAIVRADGQPTDWWEDAKSFVAYREEQTPYVVNPNFKLEIDYGNTKV